MYYGHSYSYAFRRSLSKIADLAKQFNIPVEQLLRLSFEEFIARPQEDFQKALEYVLEKNKELYKRLA